MRRVLHRSDLGVPKVERLGGRQTRDQIRILGPNQKPVPKPICAVGDQTGVPSADQALSRR